MNKLETLKKEARGALTDFLPRHWEACQGWDGSSKKPIACTCASGPVRVEMKARVDDLITHVYQQAIEDAKGALPKERVVDHLGEDPGNFLQRIADGIAEGNRDGYNEYRAEAVTALEALTKDV